MKRSFKHGTGKPLKHGTSKNRSAKAQSNIQHHPTLSHPLDVQRSMADVSSRRSRPEADRCSRVQAQAPPSHHSSAIHSPDKSSPVQILESAIATRRKSQTELSGLGKSLAEISARQAALEATGDLQDTEVLTELVHLQISTGLLPRRIAVKEECDANAERALTQATNQFIREHLGPRVRLLAERTRALVKAELSPHFPDPAALLVAVMKSERVRTIESLSWSVTDQPPRGALEHAEGALNAWASADKFETTQLAAPRLDPIEPGSTRLRRVV